jgi:hypothetical protein
MHFVVLGTPERLTRTSGPHRFGAPSAPFGRLRQPRIELPTHSINLVTLVLIALPGSTWFVARDLIAPNHPYLKVVVNACRLDARS